MFFVRPQEGVDDYKLIKLVTQVFSLQGKTTIIDSKETKPDPVALNECSPWDWEAVGPTHGRISAVIPRQSPFQTNKVEKVVTPNQRNKQID